MKRPETIPSPAEDEVAAAGGSYILAVTRKLDAMAGAALDELAKTGAFLDTVEQLGAWAVVHSDVPPSELFDELLDDRAGFYAFAAQVAIDFMEGHTAPADDEPWPAEFAAAHLLLDAYLFGHRVVELRFRLVRERVLDLAGVAELAWIAMRIGAMSETFRPGSRDMAARLAEVQAKLDADKKTKKEAADATNRLRSLELETRDAIVKVLADGFLSQKVLPAGYSSWTREGLAGEVRDAWPDDEAGIKLDELEGKARATAKGKAKPSLGKIKASLKRLNLSSEA